MNYSDFKQHHLKSDNFYNYLVRFANEIVKEVALTNKKQTALSLGMDPTRFSYVFKIIKAIINTADLKPTQWGR